MHSISDLSVKARIRNEAINTFGRHGFRGSTVRMIAEAAEVSPALVIHYFGSKEQLISSCDDYVSTRLSHEVETLERNPSGEQVLYIWRRAAEYRPLASYVIAAVRENMPFARTFIAIAIDLTERYFRQAVSLGLARPAANERCRAELMVLLKLGILTLGNLVLPADTDPSQVPDAVNERFASETMDLLTEPTLFRTEYLQPLRDAVANMGTENTGDQQ